MSMQDETPSQDTAGHSRRGFLRNAALAGAGAGAATAGTAALGATPAFADSAAQSRGTGTWRPDTTALRFTLAVMPDTQFLYWGSQDSVDRTPQEESFRYVIGNSGHACADNIVFLAHLGDLTQDADPSSFQQVDKAFGLLDAHGAAYSVLAGQPRRERRRQPRRHGVPADHGPAALQARQDVRRGGRDRLQHRARLRGRRPLLAAAGPGLADRRAGFRPGPTPSSRPTRSFR